MIRLRLKVFLAGLCVVVAGFRPSYGRQDEYAPFFVGREMPPSIHETAAHQIDIKCKARGNPEPKVKWFKNDELIGPKSRRFEPYQIRQWKLSIPNATPNDSGVYRCQVSNTKGTIERNTTVTVLTQRIAGPPIIKNDDQPPNQTVAIGGNVTFKCELAELDPAAPPRIKWLAYFRVNGSFYDDNDNPNVKILKECDLNASCIKVSKHTNIKSPGLEARMLLISNVTEEDYGRYSCVIENNYGSANRSFRIDPVHLSISSSSSSFEYVIAIPTAISVGLVILVVTISLGLVLFYCRKYRTEMLEKNDAVYKLTKVLIITQQEHFHQKDQKDGINDKIIEPLVEIEKRSELVHGSIHDHETDFIFPTSDPYWELDRDHLQWARVLGEGEFGQVKLAFMKQKLNPSKTRRLPCRVAVKMLREHHTDDEIVELVKEMEIMKHAGNHPNIINLLGVCTQPHGKPFYLVIEYAEYGSLKEFLQAHRPSPLSPSSPLLETSASPTLSTSQFEGYEIPISMRNGDFISWGIDLNLMLEMGREIASGMAFLTSKNIVHRDLAARNILVAKSEEQKLIMKIADFGLARDVTTKLYYRKVTSGKLPIKWMAPEAIFERIFSPASDVWSFGVVLWEILTLAKSPYGKLDLDSFIEFISSGNRLHQPFNCPDSMYKIMLQCWEYDPRLRPSFNELYQYLAPISHTVGSSNYLELSPPPFSSKT